jgi:hypothetical protein
MVVIFLFDGTRLDQSVLVENEPLETFGHACRNNVFHYLEVMPAF